jgi:hypothetical protein
MRRAVKITPDFGGEMMMDEAVNMPILLISLRERISARLDGPLARAGIILFSPAL